MYYSETENRVHPIILILLVCFATHLIEEAFPIFPLIVCAVVIAPILIFSTCNFLGRRFLNSSVCFCIGWLWLGATKYAQEVREAALNSDDFTQAIKYIGNEAFYYNPYITVPIGIAMLGLSVFFFCKSR